MIFAVMLMTLVSCGKDNKTQANNPNFNPNNNCGFNQQFGCQQPGPKSDWVINTNFRNFPSKIKLIVAGQVVLDECSRSRGRHLPGRIQRSRNTGQVKITINNYFSPVPGLLPMEIVRLGKRCMWWSTYYYQGNVDFNLGSGRNGNRQRVTVVLPQK